MIRNRLLTDSKGVAMMVVIMLIIMLALIASFVASLSYNQRRLVDASSGKRIKIYYAAQAGLVDANWRIRTDYTTGLTPAGSFATATYAPNPYFIDVDENGTNDVKVTIGAVNTNGLRPIDSVGLDS